MVGGAGNRSALPLIDVIGFDNLNILLQDRAQVDKLRVNLFQQLRRVEFVFVRHAGNQAGVMHQFADRINADPKHRIHRHVVAVLLKHVARFEVADG